MGWVRGEWKPTEAEARAELAGGLYGEEYDAMEGRLDQVAEGVLRDLAAKLAALDTPNLGILDEPGTLEKIEAWEAARDQIVKRIDPDQSDD